MAAKRTNAYILFCSENRTIVRQENPNTSNKDINVMLLETWKSISEDSKSTYRNRARDLNSGLSIPSSSSRKEGMRTYVEFCREKRDSVKRKYPNKNGREITSILASMWREFKINSATTSQAKTTLKKSDRIVKKKVKQVEKVDHLSLLPLELFDHVCSFLDKNSITTLSKCSSGIRQRIFMVYRDIMMNPMYQLLFRGHSWLDALCDSFMMSTKGNTIKCTFDQRITNVYTKSKIRYRMIHMQQIDSIRTTDVVLSVQGYDSIGIVKIQSIVEIILKKWLENANKKNIKETLQLPHKKIEISLSCSNTLRDTKQVCKEIEEMLFHVASFRKEYRSKVLDISVNTSGYNLRNICTYKLVITC